MSKVYFMPAYKNLHLDGNKTEIHRWVKQNVVELDGDDFNRLVYHCKNCSVKGTKWWIKENLTIINIRINTIINCMFGLNVAKEKIKKSA